MRATDPRHTVKALLMCLIAIAGMACTIDQQQPNSKPAEFVEVKVYGVGTGSNGTPVIVLQDPISKKGFSMTISVDDALAIKNLVLGRETGHITTDGMKLLIDGFGYKFEKAVIDDAGDHKITTLMYLKLGTQERAVSCIATDCVQLALRYEKPIFAKISLIENSQPPEEPPSTPTPNANRRKNRPQAI